MAGGRAFFKELDEKNEQELAQASRGDLLRAKGLDTLIAWENESVSEHSPGAVSTEETLRRAIFSGNDLDPNDNPTPAAFVSIVDTGFSMDRCTHASLDESRTRADAKVSSDSARRGSRTEALGYLEIPCSVFRNLQTGPKADDQDGPRTRVTGVYDTAIADNKSHAEAFMLIRHSNKHPERRIRGELRDQLKGKFKKWPPATGQ